MQTFEFAQLAILGPELLLAGGAMTLLMLGVFIGDTSTRIVTGLSVALLAIAALWLLWDPASGSAFNDAVLMDPFAVLMKILILIGSGAAIAMSVNFAKEENFARFEYPILVILATIGMLIMVSANDLIALYLGLEMQALALYVIAAINRDSLRSTEAGLKYFVLGALSSGMLLYGMSLVYGFTGHTNFAGVAEAMTANRSLGLVFGIVFVLAGIAFKISAVPFLLWTPDVFEGAPTPVTAFFSVAPKIAAMAMLVRVVYGAFEPAVADWQQIITFIAIASMGLGAFAAIGQTNIKRLMAYSSIAIMGFALVGLAAGSQEGVSGVVLYLIIYMGMTLGTFACILAMRRTDGMVEDISDLAGLSKSNPMMALALTIPSAVALMVVPFALVTVLFERGASDIDDTAAIATAVMIYGLGLPAFVLQKILQPIFFARENTRSPLNYALVAMVVNAGLAVGLAPLVGWIAPAIATTLAGWAMFACLAIGARRYEGAAKFDARFHKRIWRILAASAVMGVVIWLISAFGTPLFGLPGWRWLALSGIVAGGAAAYLVAGQLLGAFKMSEYRAALRRG